VLVLEHLRSLAGLPTLVKGGLVLMAIAGLADLVAHLEAVDHAGHLHTHTTTQTAAHLAALASMVVIFVGVVIDGVRTGRARRRSAVAARDQEGVP
jgi:hypothetical protein